MFIRRTAIKSRETGEPYYTYRLVESVRTGRAVRQHTVLNLGRQFEAPRAQWGSLAQRIEALVQGNSTSWPTGWSRPGRRWPSMRGTHRQPQRGNAGAGVRRGKRLPACGP